jgi:HlyD family secretion protein
MEPTPPARPVKSMTPTSSMDIPRPSQAKAKRKRRIMLAAIGGVVLIGITWGLSRLKPAAPSVDRNVVYIDTVKRGPMVRQVHGIGTLVPEEISWIAARTQGHVDRLVLRPGAEVEPDSVILVLSDPTVVQTAATADSQLKAAEANLMNFKMQLQSTVLAAEADSANAQSEDAQAHLTADANERLHDKGLQTDLQTKLSEVAAQAAATRSTIAQKRLTFARDSMAPQVAAQEASVDQLRLQAKLRHDELDALNVRAGMHGVLQLLPVDVGAVVGPGTNLARVANPKRLKAAIQVAETQAKDILIGQLAQVDTRNGIVTGKVVRVDPSVQNGTVTVDITLIGDLPKGARPDLSIDGTIELERLDNVMYVGRPPVGQEGATIGIFKLEADGVYAIRTPVQLGRSSVNSIEIIKGLAPGDRVILSDMSQWDANDRIKLN